MYNLRKCIREVLSSPKTMTFSFSGSRSSLWIILFDTLESVLVPVFPSSGMMNENPSLYVCFPWQDTLTYRFSSEINKIYLIWKGDSSVQALLKLSSTTFDEHYFHWVKSCIKTKDKKDPFIFTFKISKGQERFLFVSYIII